MTPSGPVMRFLISCMRKILPITMFRSLRRIKMKNILRVEGVTSIQPGKNGTVLLIISPEAGDLGCLEVPNYCEMTVKEAETDSGLAIEISWP